MFRTLIPYAFAVTCFIYLVLTGAFIGLAYDYEVVGYGLIPVIAYPVALVMAILAYSCYRMAFIAESQLNSTEE